MGGKHYGKAAGFFELNIANYPHSGNVYDSYGDWFAAAKDTLNAMMNYKKAFTLNASAETKQKIDALEGKQIKLSQGELQKYVGNYTFETIPLTAAFFVKEDALWEKAPG